MSILVSVRTQLQAILPDKDLSDLDTAIGPYVRTTNLKITPTIAEFYAIVIRISDLISTMSWVIANPYRVNKLVSTIILGISKDWNSLILRNPVCQSIYNTGFTHYMAIKASGLLTKSIPANPITGVESTDTVYSGKKKLRPMATSVVATSTAPPTVVSTTSSAVASTSAASSAVASTSSSAVASTSAAAAPVRNKLRAKKTTTPVVAKTTTAETTPVETTRKPRSTERSVASQLQEAASRFKRRARTSSAVASTSSADSMTITPSTGLYPTLDTVDSTIQLTESPSTSLSNPQLTPSASALDDMFDSDVPSTPTDSSKKRSKSKKQKERLE